jgi:hypothetical protein
MKTDMPKVKLLVYSFIILSLFSGIASCQDELSWNITTKIEIRSDGSATWIIQKKTMLKTESDKAAFLQNVNLTSIDEFSNNVRSIVNDARMVTGRAMNVPEESLDITASVFNTTTGLEGIIQYQFDWIGFAKETENGRIKIGDALNGQLDLSWNDILIIQYPSGYIIEFVDPRPDDTSSSDRTITWYGPRNFGMGEPTIILGKKTSGITDFLTSNTFVISGLVILIISSLGSLWVFKLKGSKTKQSVKVGEIKPLQIELEGEEDKVINLLKAAGGSLSQKAIAEHCGFSKSKTSELLKDMERKGIITRKKKGREKIVILMEKK